jgi:signal transduction histidine kinase
MCEFKAIQVVQWCRSAIATLLRLPRAVGSSLYPAEVDEARQIEAQLNLVRANVRLLSYALPPIGVVIIFVHAGRVPLAQMVWMFIGSVVGCILSELALGRWWPRDSEPIARSRKAACLVSLSALVLMTAWGLFALSLFAPPGSDILPLLVLSCSLAAAVTMFAPHAATATGAAMALCAAITVLEFRNSYGTYSPLITLAALYMAVMVGQGGIIHLRFNKAWRLEQDRENLIKDLQFAHEGAVKASRAKSEFLANMSHELRTPLNAIIGFSDIVKTKAFGNAAERYSEYGGFINQSGHHLLAMISNILELAKIEAGRKTLYQEPVDVIGVVQDALQRAEAKATEKRVIIQSTLPRTLPLLRADMHAVQQILAHLVSNAVKFTQAGGQVEISAALTVAGEIAFTVVDTGIGIPPEDQPYVFDRFGQAVPEITTAHRGTGLGLPIVKGLADMHGARLALDSQLGEGTRVTIIFPAASTLADAALSAA